MFMKNKILSSVERRIPLTDYEKRLFLHGMDIILCDGSSFLSCILLSFLFHRVTETAVYLILFSALRINSGGWHAATRCHCFMSFSGLYLLYLVLLNVRIPLVVSAFIFLSSRIIILYNCPVEHCLQPLSQKEIDQSRMNITLLLLLLLILFIFKADTLAFVIATVCGYDALLMMILKKSKNWRYADGNQMSDC